MQKTKKSMQTLLESSGLFGANACYLESLYDQFLKAPATLEPGWRAYFEKLVAQDKRTGSDMSQAALNRTLTQWQARSRHAPFAAQINDQTTEQAIALTELMQAYLTQGHFSAHTNPIAPCPPDFLPALRWEAYPALAASENKRFAFEGQHLTPSQICAHLKSIYCGPIGAEFMHLRDRAEHKWIQKRLASAKAVQLNTDEKQRILKQLITADGLEKYLGNKYVGKKRFSIEGADALIPLVRTINARACKNGVQEIVMGMTHRGRLNILTNVLAQPTEVLFAQFEGTKDYGMMSGDVSYHMGYASDVDTPCGQIHLSLAFVPSHLEAVTPVVMGSVRARQHRRQGRCDEVMAVSIHGDASFAGQGIIMESLQMSKTRAYGTGGTIHIVINNQVGFTTSSTDDSRSGYYCTDIAKMIDSPVFHVNGDDPEAVVFVGNLAADYRACFHKDVFIDLVCYRRLGHNEADEPSATQPVMYQTIRRHPVPYRIYAERLIAEKVCTSAEVESMVQNYRDALDAKKSLRKTHNDSVTSRNRANWKPYFDQHWTAPADTRFDSKQLLSLAEALEKLPEGFIVQRQVKHTLDARKKMRQAALPIDWGYAETLAYASLLKEGYPVRISGQDCRRGTFAHRHAVLHEQETGAEYTPLCHLPGKQAIFQIYDSLLSEFGVVGFEYGYSTTEPRALVIWEAQYGDFANGAQVMFDQFLSSARQKWGVFSGLVLFLPHGYEGSGPEHTSARLERFLQLCAQENLQVCIPTTPAQMFHLLRRQILRSYRAPLVVMTPKSLLRNKQVNSSLAELSEGCFHCVIPEIDPLPTQQVDRLIICSGKVYYDLLKQRREQKNHKIAIVRMEQLYPFPEDIIRQVLNAYAHVQDIVWCQEEPENQGAWEIIIRSALQKCLQKNQSLRYVGRPASAAPAAGYMALHKKKQSALIAAALGRVTK